MLSNPNSSLQQRQRQHRRQNSTPTTFNTPKVPILPATPSVQRHGLHRRGLSVDQRILQPRQPQQDETTVSTNPGLQQTQQHILREAQQQRQARPGQYDERKYSSVQCAQAGPFDYIDACFRSNYGLSNDTPLNTRINDVNSNYAGHNKFSTTVHGAGDDSLGSYCVDSNPAARLGLGRDEQFDYRQNEGPVVNVVAGRPATTFNHGGQNTRKSPPNPLIIKHERPKTPPNQMISDLKPITPATTPFRRVPQTESLHRHSLLESPSSRDETIKASGSKKLPPVGSCQELFSPPKSRPGGLPSPPITTAMSFPATHDTAPMPNPSDFMMDLSMNFNFPANEQEYDSSSYSPLSTALSPSQSSLLSSPEMEQLALFGNPLETAPRLEVPGENMTSPSSKIAAGLCDGSSPTNGALSPGAMSIADLSIDATVEDTGITIDDIASFIEGPEPSDGKWVCSFPECNKRFGRKENIKSHVQTHLGDRQFRCNHCHKCFVRQHDLKRHSKIHSGVKPYPCLCGNSFARHDALTRHRQRGMCIGAFEGAVKKVAKRGRPRKQRPEAEARREKASKTRKRAIAMSTTSSSSGNSNQSSQHSPALTYESFSSRETSPLDVLTHGLESDVTPMPRYTFNYTPPTSPDHGLGTYVSPQHIQKMHSPVSSFGESPKRNSVVSNFEGSVALPSNPTSPSKRCSSHDNTPPELCLASSSPPPMNFFDLDKASAQLGGNADMGRKANGGEDELVDYRIPGIDDPEPDMFLSFDNTEDDLASLEKEFGLLKDFDNGMSNDDLFQDPGCGTDMFF